MANAGACLNKAEVYTRLDHSAQQITVPGVANVQTVDGAGLF